MLRTVRANQEIKSQFSIFDIDGYTKISGEAENCVATLWKDGELSGEEIAVSEIGTSGEYLVSFTPTSAGIWILEIKDPTNRIWKSEIEVRLVDLDSVASDLLIIKKIETGRWRINSVDNTMTFYDEDGETELFKFNLKDASGAASATEVFERIPE
ncbi:MAG: hypothetical protein WC476_01070 [Phycisphaerae bacterium]|jgi:hypothetical protein